MRIPPRLAATGLATGFLALTALGASAQTAPLGTPTDVVATVGAAKITLGEVDERALKRQIGEGGVKLIQAIYDSRREVLEELVGTTLIQLEAKGRGIDGDTLAKQEILDKAGAPSDKEVEDWFQANTARLQGAKLDDVKDPIRELLARGKLEATRARFLDTLRAKTPVNITLDPPRERVTGDNRPSKGSSTATVELVEFADFQCPFCIRAHPTVAKVLETYGNRIRFVFRNFPLASHPDARPAAEAGACAAEQGKFWELHDRLFAGQTKLGIDDLKQHASAVGVDAARFNACLDQRKFQKDIDADIEMAGDAGVNATPAFFVNGRPIIGAQPFEAFKRIIDEELALKAQASAKK